MFDVFSRYAIIEAATPPLLGTIGVFIVAPDRGSSEAVTVKLFKTFGDRPSPENVSFWEANLTGIPLQPSIHIMAVLVSEGFVMPLDLRAEFIRHMGATARILGVNPEDLIEYISLGEDHA